MKISELRSWRKLSGIVHPEGQLGVNKLLNKQANSSP